jgi:hypothetical protein
MTSIIDVTPNKSSVPAGQAVDPRLAEHVAEIRRLGKRLMEDAIEIGRRLIECQAILQELHGHGHWYAWLDKEFGWSKQTALNFVRAYEMSKSTNFVDFNFDLPVSALYLLAAPTTPETVRTEVIEKAKAGERVFVANVQKAIAGTRATKAPKAKPKSTVKTVDAKPLPKPTEPPKTKCADIIAAWNAAPLNERKRAVDAIGLVPLLDALPLDWWSDIEQQIVFYKKQLSTQITATAPSVIPDDLSIPASLDRRSEAPPKDGAPA